MWELIMMEQLELIEALPAHIRVVIERTVYSIGENGRNWLEYKPHKHGNWIVRLSWIADDGDCKAVAMDQPVTTFTVGTDINGVIIIAADDDDLSIAIQNAIGGWNTIVLSALKIAQKE